MNWKLPKNQFSFFQMNVFVHGCTRRIKNNLISRSVAFWNKIKIEKRKTKGFFKNIQIKIENYKLKKKQPFSIFNFEMKLKYTKMSFSIPVLKSSVYKNIHFIFVQFLVISKKWKLIFPQFSIQFSIFNNFKQMKIGFGEFSIRFLFPQITEKIENWFFGNFQFFTLWKVKFDAFY